MVNARPSWICERHFLDNNNLRQSEIVCFTFQYEPDYLNLPVILKANNIPLGKEQRQQILIAGGPCITANPQTLAPYMDVLVCGELEGVMDQILDAYEQAASKEAFLDAIKNLQGVIVPGKTATETTATITKLEKVPYPLYQPLPETLDKRFVFGKKFMLETERSCAFACKFCSIPGFYDGLKMRSLENLREIIDLGLEINQRSDVAIYAPSFLHPKRKDILQHLLEKGCTFSLPSFRVEYADREQLELTKRGGQKTLTIAPECNERLRLQLGKNLKDDVFFKFVDEAADLRFEILKLYLLIGLPDQTKEDLDETISFIQKTRQRFRNRVYLSINPFVPKPKTPLASHPFDKKKIKEQAAYLQKQLIGIRQKVISIPASYREWKLAHATSLSLR